ncbi:MAG: prepilin-type N-terminal cleavage/methylation domain-containing protein [Gemmatimonadetes bacterium]|nr:prepilin-type N-terminal cleavage/methylation domain-containing protein [Gemmatimonadota bacterium]
MKRRRRVGFTLIELLITVTIVGILARIAIPAVSQFRLRARATNIINDLEVIRSGAFGVMADSGVWPLDAAAGTVPPEMVPYVPAGTSFTPEPGVTYDWRLTGMPGGDPGAATAAATMAMGVEATDPALSVEIERLMAGQATLITGGTIYWLLWGPTIRP